MTTQRPTEAGPPQHVTTVEGISEFQLDNGTRILLFPDPSKPQVTVNMTVFVGSRHEGYGEAGMAHLLEHMVFKGTPDHPAIPKVLKEHGAQFNGTTWLDRTNYYETLPASDANLEFAIRLEADRLVNSYVKKEDLDSEMTVVRNEFERGENSPTNILDQRIMSAAFEWHNYGQSTIGNRVDIERVPIENLQAFYRKYYQPDNIMVIVAGQFDPEKALSLITETFGSIPRPDRVLPKTYTEEPAQDGERSVTLRRVGDIGACGAVYHIPSGGHPEYASIDVLEHVLTSSPSGRLYKALVETKRASRVSGSAYALHDPGVIRFIAEAAPGNDPRDILSALLEITETIGDEGVTEEEVERAKRYWMKSWEMSLADSSRLAIQLTEWAAQGDWRLMFLYRDQLEKVTTADVNAVAKKYLVRNNRTSGLFIPTEKPEKATVPPSPNLAELIGDYQGREGMAAGESFDVSPENIEQRTERFELPGGLKVAFLPKKTRGAEVQAQLTLRYGDAESLKGKTTAASVLPSLMLRGTESRTRQQIQDDLDENKARLSSSGSTGTASFALKTRNENLVAVLEILADVLRHPTLPEAELEILRNQNLAAYEKQLTDPTSLARIAVSQKINSAYGPDDVRYVPSSEEQIARWKELKLEDIRSLYSEFLNGQHGELAIVGDFDPAEARKAIEGIFADWKSEHAYEHIERLGNLPYKPERVAINTPGKENATYIAGSVFPLRDDNAEFPALMIGNYVLGSSGLASRLGDRIRQQEGLSYGVGSFVQASSEDPRTSFLVYAITNPQNMGKVETAMKEEIGKLVAEGVTPEELADAQKGYLERQTVDRSDDSELARILCETAQLGRTMEFFSSQEKTVAALKVDDVNSALKKYIDFEQLVIVVAGEFEKE
ncbi:MAG: insulinase family protein [Planctomycetaceae bacterium]|nr:insulinase family protein [Planctomycetaceae bacterium]